jgi:rubrerythrin
MERGHIVVLTNMDKKGFPPGPEKRVVNLSISDYLVKPKKPVSELEYQDILILAMKREEASLKLYTDLASQIPGTPQAELFTKIANEEAGHKLKFETLYDQDILKEN